MPSKKIHLAALRLSRIYSIIKYSPMVIRFQAIWLVPWSPVISSYSSDWLYMENAGKPKPTRITLSSYENRPTKEIIVLLLLNIYSVFIWMVSWYTIWLKIQCTFSKLKESNEISQRNLLRFSITSAIFMLPDTKVATTVLCDRCTHFNNIYYFLSFCSS